MQIRRAVGAAPWPKELKIQGRLGTLARAIYRDCMYDITAPLSQLHDQRAFGAMENKSSDELFQYGCAYQCLPVPRACFHSIIAHAQWSFWLLCFSVYRHQIGAGCTKSQRKAVIIQKIKAVRRQQAVPSSALPSAVLNLKPQRSATTMQKAEAAASGASSEHPQTATTPITTLPKQLNPEPKQDDSSPVAAATKLQDVPLSAAQLSLVIQAANPGWCAFSCDISQWYIVCLCSLLLPPICSGAVAGRITHLKRKSQPVSLRCNSSSATSLQMPKKISACFSLLLFQQRRKTCPLRRPPGRALAPSRLGLSQTLGLQCALLQ